MLADAPPLKEGTPPGFYLDPLGGAKLRKWDGSQWTNSVRKIQITDCKRASTYRHYRLTVPRSFPFADPYRVLDGDGRECFELIPGSRWFYRQLRVSDAKGAEVARLRRSGRWWWARWEDELGYELLRAGHLIARVSPEGILRVMGPNSSKTFIVSRPRGERMFVHELLLVARLIPHRRRLRRTILYDLDIALGVDPIPIFGGCVAVNQSGKAAGVGGLLDGLLGG